MSGRGTMASQRLISTALRRSFSTAAKRHSPCRVGRPLAPSTSALPSSFSRHGFHKSSLHLADTEAKAETTEANVAQDDDEQDLLDVKFAFTPPPPLSAESQKKVDELFDKVLYLDLVEVHMLTLLIHQKMGGSWRDLAEDGSAGPARAAATAGDDAGAEPENALKDVKLVGFDAKAKIKVIKEVRSILSLGLKEAKELVESAPKVVQKGVKPEQAEELKKQLEAVGAQVEIE